jgi:acyl-coenzyme A thioesterase PaaI-like protein
MTTAGAQDDLVRTRAQRHAHCWVCSPSNGRGLTVGFTQDSAGVVEGKFACDGAYAGYRGYIHGGVVSSLLDGAMTNCLLARGCVAVTADLRVRFRHPVATGSPATVRAWLERSRRQVHVLGAELLQDGQVRATAVGKFMRHPQEE